MRCVRLEFTSRGDRVPGRLLLPPDDVGEGPYPVILFQHLAATDRASLQTVAPWVQCGAAVASIDLPLHGERASGKISELLSRPLLWQEFLRQSVLDLQRATDVLQDQGDVAHERLGYDGIGLGAVVGAAFCTADPRPRAVALAPAAEGAEHLGDLETVAARVAPRPAIVLSDPEKFVGPIWEFLRGPLGIS